MAIGYTDVLNYSAIANAIREKTKTTDYLRPSEMAPAILNIKGGGNVETTDPEELYEATRPTDWLKMPTESEINDNELYLLFHIPDNSTAPIAFSVECTGSYTVSLLTSESHTIVSSRSISSGSTYNAELSSSDFGDLTSTGMKQALIKISGTDITSWKVQDYAGKYYDTCSWNIVEIAGKLTKLTSLKCYNDPGNEDADKALTRLRYFSLYGSNQITDASNMFKCCLKLLLVKNLNTSSITNMSNMFFDCESLRAIPQFDTSNVTNMTNLFNNAGYNASSLNISGWNTSKVTTMHGMLLSFGRHATTLNLDLSSWDVSNVTDMWGMLKDTGYGAITWSVGDLSGWNTSKVTNMEYMFCSTGYNALSWSIGDISNWNVSNATNMASMFQAVGRNTIDTWKLDLSGWDTSNVTHMGYMFNGCPKLKTIYVSDLWNIDKVSSSTSMFEGCTSLIGGNGTTYNSSYVDKTYAVIDTTDAPGYLSEKPYKLTTGLKFNALIPTSTKSIVFTNEVMPSSATAIDLSTDEDGYNPVIGWLDGTKFKVSTQKPGRKILANEDCSYMFCGEAAAGNKTTTTQNLTSITGLDILDTSNTTNMACMFDYAFFKATQVDIVLPFNTSKVTNMRAMFFCVGYNARDVIIGISSFDVSNVVNMSLMFAYVGYKVQQYHNVTFGTLTNWNTAKVTDMSKMFLYTAYNGGNISLGSVANWNTSSVTNMSQMFKYTAYFGTITIGLMHKWNTSNVTNMDEMFYYTASARVGLSRMNLSGWNVNKVTSHSNFNTGNTSQITPPKWVH